MIKTLLYLIVIGTLVFSYAKYIELRSVYFPSKEIEVDPAYIGLAFEDVYITTDDNIKINGWFAPAPQAKYTVLFLHGNGGNISHRLDKISMFNKIGLNTFIIDYRGYGRSKGSPSEAGIYRDARCAYDYLINERKTDPQRVVVYGESLGTAVTIDLASKVKVKGIILEGAFSSGKDMARRFYPMIPNFLFSDSFNSLKKITKITAAKLFLHSKNDEIVPIALARKLFDLSPPPKQFRELIGSHNTAFLDSKDAYLSAITAFFINLP